jgi:hypothetical protein
VAVTGPFERVYNSREWPVLRGTVNLDAGTHTVHADLLRGTAQLEYIEEIDDVITTFGVHEPVRYLNTRRRVRLVIEADLDGMVFHFDPATLPGNG